MMTATETSPYGWLSPVGQYIEVPDCGMHDDTMYDVINLNVRDAEEIGWIHLSEGNYYHYGKGLYSHITPEQRRWLVHNDYDLREGDEE